ncbi:MAG: LysR family transcriptional regulator [Propionivibrio sp.]|uniref:LysR family transcriptional regulator n=1 Tax=Propionivibrio sp. TaxID=2212460 RepID=UPI0025CCD8C0|nr:LysR family transcriptional regulator [Propionivibrio sp.]MBK7355024.1 LysR family transcriptional regulator [Propionivibrio sp.]MBK8402394.1 LysR family transcriptional regulator [Propionivibrio sp.]
MRYDLTDLRLFIAIAEARNLTRGAASVHLAPSSASHRLRLLEEELGTPLFERRARGLTLTRAGETLLRNARQVFAQIEQMHADLSPFAEGVRGHVSLWANTHATHTFLPDDLADFLKRNPQLSVSLEEHTSPEISLAVSRGEVEVGVLAEADSAAEVELIPYHRDRLVFVVPGGHALAARARVRFSEVLDYPFVMLHAGSAIHTFTMNAAAALGRHLDVRIQVRSFGAVCRMVGAGVGIGLVPRSAVPAAALPEPPVVVELDETWAQRDLQICVKQQTKLSGFAAALVDSLKSKADADL